MRKTIIAVIALIAASAAFAQDKPGSIKASGKPSGAGVFVDGTYLGPASRFTVTEKYGVAAGEHEIIIRDPRYQDFSTKVTVRPGKTTKISYKLSPVEPAKPPFGRLRLGSGEPESFMSVAAGDAGAVYINDRFYGYVDEMNNPGSGLLLNPGTYKVKVVSQVYGEVSQQVTIEADKVTMMLLSKSK